MKTAEKRSQPAVSIPACRCGDGHAAHTHGDGPTGLSVGPCKACPCTDWSPYWHDRYPSLQKERA